MFISSIIAITTGYFIGCIHGSRIAQILSGVDLKKTGHGNAGASNATLSLGWKYGVLVALIDIGKGALTIILYREISQAAALNYSEADHLFLLYMIGAGVILGHNFPFYMRFNGGKGTASVIGIFLALDWKIGLIALGLLIVLALLTNYLIIGVFSLYIIFCAKALFWTPGESTIFIALVLFGISAILHIENVKRLLRGEEPKVTSAFKKKSHIS